MLSGATTEALTPLQADELLSSCEKATALLVAVSGGPDSTALLLLASQWKEMKPGRPAVFAATVDHGLRPDSRAEAESVAEWCADLGMPHFLLSWEGPKPATRLQERARDARYALLLDCARKVGASMLLTAHHADDQYETILFRLLRGSSVAGLAGMARETRRGDLIHARPLLDLPKSALVALCESRGHPYFRDPSNGDPRFARARVRGATAALEKLGFGPEGALRLSKRAARAEAALRAFYADFIETAVIERGAERTTWRGAALAAAPEELVLRLISSEAARLAGREPPRLEQAETLTARLREALAAGISFRIALGGVLFSLKDQILELREEDRKHGRDSRLRANLSAKPLPCVETPVGSLVKGGQDA